MPLKYWSSVSCACQSLPNMFRLGRKIYWLAVVTEFFDSGANIYIRHIIEAWVHFHLFGGVQIQNYHISRLFFLVELSVTRSISFSLARDVSIRGKCGLVTKGEDTYIPGEFITLSSPFLVSSWLNCWTILSGGHLGWIGDRSGLCRNSNFRKTQDL